MGGCSTLDPRLLYEGNASIFFDEDMLVQDRQEVT